MEKTKLPKHKTKRSGVKTFLRWLKIILIILVVFIIAVGIFVKLDAPAAANIADNYLRPIIGDQRVIFLEDKLFNLSDSADKLIYDFKKPEGPQFLGENKVLNNSSTLDLTPLIPNQTLSPISDEGVWNNLSSAVSPDTEVMATTFIRPDSARSYAVVSIVQIDMKLLGIGSVAGTKEPGGSLGNPGTGLIPQDILDSDKLVAAFNGGFLYTDGQYGMIADNKTYAPLKIGVGTIAAYTDGSIKIFNYDGNNLGDNVFFARQNSPLIVDNGQVTIMSAASQKMYGRVLHGGTFTWRSGIGITKSGNLLYVAGNNLSPITLADALQTAGAVNAIQLDINPSQVHFYTFTKNSAGTYDSVALNKELQSLNKPARYFTGSQRDFFYLYQK